jgi:1-acyl-sn-glycerol-3-phosphate acyltransferase
MRAVKIATRVVCLIFILAGFFVCSAYLEVDAVFRRLSYGERQRKRSNLVRWFSSVLLAKLGFVVDIRTRGSIDFAWCREFLIVANHIGFWDALVLSSFTGCVFITSEEVGAKPFLGWLSKLGGCILVDRRSKSNLSRDIGRVARALREGPAVAIFPEGTSTDGRAVLPFKKSLFRAAAETGAAVLPVAICYPVSEERDAISYCGNQHFIVQLARSICLDRVEVRVVLHQPFAVPKNGHKAASDMAYDVIRETLIDGLKVKVSWPQEQTETKHIGSEVTL